MHLCLIPATILLLAPPGDNARASDVSCTMEQLQHMCWAELDALYRASSVGKPPCGYLEGRAIYCQGERGAKVRTLASRVAWKGKHFEDCSIVNQWCGFRAVRARVYPGE